MSATTGNPTFLGAYMQAIALLAAGYLVRSWCAASPASSPPGAAPRKRRKSRRRASPPARLFWGVTLVCAICALALTGAVGAAGLMLALALGVRAAGSAGGDAYQPAFDNILLERATSVERIGNTLAPRLRNWRSGLLAFAERPLLGWGTGNYFAGSARHISAREQGNQVNDHAHNVPMVEAATKGIAGLAAYLLLWGLTAAAVLRRVRTAGPLRLLRQAARIGPCRPKNPD